MNILISAGPTLEPIDAVRFISNRSSGKMGLALLDEALTNQHEIIFVHGPIFMSERHKQVNYRAVETAREMLDELKQHFEWCDVLIMAAAVCDMRPSEVSDVKRDKSDLNQIDFVPNPDLLQEICKLKQNQKVVSYSLENSLELDRPIKKMRAKGADYAVINPTSSMSSDQSSFKVIDSNGHVKIDLEQVTKREFAAALFSLIEQ